MTAASMNIQMVGSDEVLLKNMVMNFIDRLPADENLTVVSIIGRQNTGKSYLLNSLFGTYFNVLDPQQNHGQTTRGIWIAQCPTNPSIVVIDIEGSDSSTNAEEFSRLRDMKDTTSLVSFQRSLAEFLTSTLEQFDESADGTILEIRDGFKATLQQKIIKKLEVKFLSILWTETNKKVEEKKEQISSHLRATKKGIVSSIFTLTFNLEAFESNIDVDSIVKAHVREFHEIFGGCLEEYKIFVSIYRKEVVHTLKDYAEREIMGIKDFHKIIVSIGKGVLTFVGVATSGYMLRCGASIILASFRPALADCSQAARSKIPTILEYMLQNIITPAAKICVQHMMEHRKVIAAQLGKQMFNLSMAMVAFLIKIMSDQQHCYGFKD